MEDNPNKKINRRSLLKSALGLFAATKMPMANAEIPTKIVKKIATLKPETLVNFNYKSEYHFLNCLENFLDSFNPKLTPADKLATFRLNYDAVVSRFDPKSTIADIYNQINSIDITGKKLFLLKELLDEKVTELGLKPDSTFSNILIDILKKQKNFLENLDIYSDLGVSPNDTKVVGFFEKNMKREGIKYYNDEIMKNQQIINENENPENKDKHKKDENDAENKFQPDLEYYEMLDNLKPGYGGGFDIDIPKKN